MKFVYYPIKNTTDIFKIKDIESRRGKLFTDPQGHAWFYCPCGKIASPHSINFKKWTLNQEDPLDIEESLKPHHGESFCHFHIRHGFIKWENDSQKF